MISFFSHKKLRLTKRYSFHFSVPLVKVKTQYPQDFLFSNLVHGKDYYHTLNLLTRSTRKYRAGSDLTREATMPCLLIYHPQHSLSKSYDCNVLHFLVEKRHSFLVIVQMFIATPDNR